MTTERRRLELAATGPDPRSRVAPPLEGERCPRCHRRQSGGLPLHGCLLCCPERVPVAHGGTLEASP